MKSESNSFKAKAQSISLMFCGPAQRAPAQGVSPSQGRALEIQPCPAAPPSPCCVRATAPLRASLEIWAKQTANCYEQNTELDVKLLWTRCTFKNLFGCYH